MSGISGGVDNSSAAYVPGSGTNQSLLDNVGEDSFGAALKSAIGTEETGQTDTEDSVSISPGVTDEGNHTIREDIEGALDDVFNHDGLDLTDVNPDELLNVIMDAAAAFIILDDNNGTI